MPRDEDIGSDEPSYSAAEDIDPDTDENSDTEASYGMAAQAAADRSSLVADPVGTLRSLLRDLDGARNRKDAERAMNEHVPRIVDAISDLQYGRARALIDAISDGPVDDATLESVLDAIGVVENAGQRGDRLLGALKQKLGARVSALDIDAAVDARRTAHHNGNRSGTSAPSCPRAWTPDEIAADIAARRIEPKIPLALDDGNVVAEIPVGELASLIGGTGSGKSTLALAFAEHHARHLGPAVFVSLELDRTLLGARMVGRTLRASWADIRFGAITMPADAMAALLPPRIRVLESDAANEWQDLAKQIAVEHPGEPLLVVIDYVQLLAAHVDERDIRMRVAHAVEDARTFAQRERAALVLVSQTSRAAAKSLRDGDATGADTISASAESSAIEIASHVTITIGAVGADREDGSRSVELNIGKHRMGRGDQVISASLHGAHGLWKRLAAPRSAADAKAERKAATKAKQVEAVSPAIVKKLADSSEPMSRGDIRETLGLNRDVVLAAIAKLLDTRVIVETDERRGGHRLLWTPERAGVTAPQNGAPKREHAANAPRNGVANGDASVEPDFTDAGGMSS